MKLSKTYDEKDLTIEVNGRIDTVNAPDFQNEIMDEMGKFNSLTLDCRDLEYISSSGLRVLIMMEKKLQPQNIKFTIKNLNSALREIFAMSGFDKLLNIE